MVLNPALLLVSAVFFLALSAVFYTVAWLIIALISKIRLHVLGHGWRVALFFALILPPVAASALTVGGTLLPHSHSPGHGHHSVYCGDIARFLTVPEGRMPVIAGMFVQGAAWLLLAWGTGAGICLFAATLSLERELRPFLKPPSVKLAAALVLARHGSDYANLQFFEADIPMARSCLLGIRHIRCVLSRELVSATKDEELAAVVLHEINHYRSQDVWRTLLVGFLNCVFFYMQPLRLLSRRWREETELACDAATAAHSGDPLALASAILRVQGVPTQGQPLPTVILGFSDEAACSPQKRVEQLLSYAEQDVTRPSESISMKIRHWAITIGLTVIGLAFILTPQALCTAHCSLEAIARSLR